MRLATISLVAWCSWPILFHSLDIQASRLRAGHAGEHAAGVRQGAEIGVTTLELECAITKDGVVVVSHDPVLNPKSAQSGRAWLRETGPAMEP